MIYDLGKRQTKELVKPGEYPAVVSKVESNKTKNGDDQKKIFFQLENGVTILDFITINPKVYWKMADLFYACGLPYEGKVRMSEDWHELLNKKLRIRVENEEYNGREYNRVVGYLPSEEK